MPEFRYDGDRQRYLERTHDPNDGDWSWVTISDKWHDYVGNQAWVDYDVDVSQTTGIPTAVPQTTYDVGLGMMRTVGVGGTRWFHADMLGSTRLITNSSGSTTATLNYTAFGELQPLGNPSLGQGTRYGFAGAWGYQNDALADADNDIGLLHVGARYYDPSIGRFVMRDPVSVNGGINCYLYAMATPTIVIDPTGLWGYVQIGISGAIQNFLHSQVGFRVAGTLIWLGTHPSLSHIFELPAKWGPRFVVSIPVPWPQLIQTAGDPKTVNCLITALRAVGQGWGLP